MLSRAAESLYWMTRYIERAENVARVIDVTIHMMLDLPTGSDQVEQWDPLIIASGDREMFRSRYNAPDRENTVHFLAFDPDNPNSILSSLRSAREYARAVRQFITLEMWEQVNKFYLMMSSTNAASRAVQTPHDFFSEVMIASQLFSGITDATMSHGEGWNFCRLGRMIERADKTSRILDVEYFMVPSTGSDSETPYDDILWGAVLRSISAFEMYRKKHQQISPERVVEFLVLDREFPRAMHHCVIEAEESLRGVSRTPAGTFQNAPEQHLGRMRAALDYTNVGEILALGVHEFIDDFQKQLNVCGTAIHERFFAPRPLGSPPSKRGTFNQ